MTQIRPKPFLDAMRLRRHAIGKERRLNMTKIMLEKGTPLPLPVDYSDIDQAFFNWVDKQLDLVYDGKKIPTYKLFSNQKLSEYSQTWSNLDENNNLVLNFKTITRENNPQHGESQGSNYNIPGERDYPMFCVPVLQENGEEAYDLYTMKQPISVNFMYTISLICNKYELLNEMNGEIQRLFSGIECYLYPNNHPMPMVIENISDESEYNIDDRKYYAQSYQIKLMGYIVRKDGFKVTKIPSRFVVRMLGSEEKVKYKKIKKQDNWLNKLDNEATLNADVNEKEIKQEMLKKSHVITKEDACGDVTHEIIPNEPPVDAEGEDWIPECCIPTEENPYYNKVIRFIIDFPTCEEMSVKFISTNTIEVDAIKTVNIHDFIIRVNNFTLDLDDNPIITKDDNVEVLVTREDEYADGKLIIIGSDPDVVFDSRIEYESELDEPETEEDIYIERN